MKNLDVTCKRLSFVFRLVTFVLPVFVSYVMLFHLEFAFTMGFFSKIISLDAIKYIEAFSMLERVYILGIALVPTMCTMVIFSLLSRLFMHYSQKNYFALDTIKVIKKIAIFILIAQFIDPLYQAAITYFLTIHNDGGQHFISIAVGSDVLASCILGMALLVAAHITEHARKIQLEQVLTI